MATPVEEIKQRLDIVEFIGESIQLKQSGQSWKARCPFHNEKSASFMVSRDRGTWHCFGCGRGGDIFSYIQEMEGLDFAEALRVLAKRAGVKLEPRDPKLQTQTSGALDVLRWVTKYYQEVLHKSAEAEEARAYVKKRGIDDQTLDVFGLGFAPSGWDTTYQALHKKGLHDEEIFQAGLTIKKDRGVGYIDRFRGRLMFPIQDAHGAVVGFTGRILHEQVRKDGQPLAKYVNSPQTVVYNKSAVLYGYDKAKTAIKKSGVVVVVEGNMDCITSHQFGVENVVAVSGTALTEEQIGILKRVAKRIVFAFDQDAAGAQAIIRALDHAFRSGLDLAILKLPFGKDPDECIRQDVQSWKTAIAEAKPVMEYFFSALTEGKNMLDVTMKKTVVKDMLPILAKLGDPVEQSHYLEKLADLVRVPVADLRKSITKPAHAQSVGVADGKLVKVDALPAADRFHVLSERCVALLIAHPEFLPQAADQLSPDALVGDDLQTLYKSLMVWYTHDHLVERHQLDGLVANSLPELGERYTLLSMLADKEFPPTVDAGVQQEFLSMASTLKRQQLSKQLRQLEEDIRRLERQGVAQGSEMTTLLERVRAVTEQLRSTN